MSIQWPSVAARLREVLPTLPGWDAVEVFNGPVGQGDSPLLYATVGYVSEDNGGTFTTQQDASGFRWLEVGSVISQLVAVSGDNDLIDVQTRAFAPLDALDAYIRADRTLGGVLSPDGTSQLVVDLQPIANVNGAAMTLIFTVNYTTRT